MPEHWLAKALPEHFTAGAGGAGGMGTFPTHVAEFVLADAWLINIDVMSRPVAWHIKPARIERVIKDLNEAAVGIEWRVCQSVEEARAAVAKAAAALAADQRSLKASDLYLQPVVDSATFWDEVTPKLLGADKVPALLWQFRMCTPFSYTKQEWSGVPFDEMTSHLLRATGSAGIFEVSTRGQAVTVAAWFKRTRPLPEALECYFAFDDVASEVERRAAVEEEDRFIPLFEAGWRRAFQQLAELWPNECEGGEAVQLAGTLLTQLELGAKVVNFTIAALCAMVRPHLHELDTSLLRGAPNSVRSAALAKVLQKRKGSGAMEPDGADPLSPGGAKVAASEAWDVIHAQKSYKELYAALELLNTDPVDFPAVAAMLACAASPLGLAFLAGGKPPPQPVWALMLGARHESTIQALLNDAIAVDRLGVAKPEWPALISTGDSKKFFAGLWGIGLLGEKKTGLDLWALVKAAIAKRDGEYVAKRFPSTLSAKTFYGDHVRIEYASTSLAALFKCIGQQGRDTGSVKSFFYGLSLRAKIVFDLPDIQQKVGLRELLEKAGTLVVEEAAVTHQLMLASPMAVARRPKSFMDPGGAGAKEIANFDTILAAVQAQIELMVLGLGNGSIGQPLATPSWREGYSGGGEDEWKVWPDAKRTRREDVSSSARHNGVWTSPEGVLFGKVFIAYPDHAGLGCVAQLAPSKTLAQRHKWCPKGCTDENAHTRPAGVEEDPPQLGAPDGAVWTTVCEPGQQEDQGAKGGRGQGAADTRIVAWSPRGAKGGGRGRGRGGKGKGRDAAKGGGRGAKGGSKGAGKGKGKGGKGSFRRQWE